MGFEGCQNLRRVMRVITVSDMGALKVSYEPQALNPVIWGHLEFRVLICGPKVGLL